MSILIDESVILRYILADDRKASKQAAAIISEGTSFTYPEIIARVAVILRDVYMVPRSQIGYALVELLNDISVVEEEIVRYASKLFGSTKLDYLDCLLIARNAINGDQILTFDNMMLKHFV